MDGKDRQHIDNFKDVLIEKTNFKAVYTRLLRRGVFPVSLKAFKELSDSDEENNKTLYSVIKSRGVNSYSELKRALQQSNPELLDQFEGRAWRISNEQWACSPEVYKLSNAKIRGYYCIVTMTDNRCGWENEEEMLKKTFKYLGYEGSAYKDPSKEDFNNLLTRFTEKSNAGCYVFAMSGHGGIVGGEESILQANKSYMKVNDILSQICKNPRLLNKPKIIILQACRGNMETLKTSPHGSTLPTTPVETPDIKDTIILRPCLPGYVAYRDTFSGGWFIKILSEMIQKYARERDVEEIMIMKEFYEYTDQSREMVPCVNTYSFKKFYFLPKEEPSITSGEEEPSSLINGNPQD